jgi:hypothetical protein
MELRTSSRESIESDMLPGPSAIICMADSREQLAVIKDSARVVARLDLIFNDANEAFQGVRAPTIEDARQILQFVNDHTSVPYLVVQCEVGIGRSHAVTAALLKMRGLDHRDVFKRGTYNRRLYKNLIAAAGLPPEHEPLVSLAVRVKYSPERLNLFLLSMQRQRHENWEVIGVTDGPNRDASDLVAHMRDDRVQLIETEQRLGQWGHPYRQLGLDACRGEFIGMSNDDNYYVPGYLEQMLCALESADLAMCKALHNYAAWDVAPAGTDLGSWICRASLVRQAPWTGVDFRYDCIYLDSLKRLAKDRVAIVDRPLLVHN